MLVATVVVAPLPPLDHHRPPGDHSVDFGQGSGIILNAQGFVLTNAHVVEGVDAVHVTLTDGRRFRAETRGADDIIDVAMLQIMPDEGVSSGGAGRRDDDPRLPVAQLGDSNGLEVGQFVTAIGSPGGLDNTCTIGIVSGLKRCPKVVGSECNA